MWKVRSLTSDASRCVQSATNRLYEINCRQTQGGVIINRMFRLSSYVALTCFCLWILPLGVFIKPSQEGTACGGKRAFHMCSMEMGKARPTESSQKISFTNASGSGQQGKSSTGTSGDDFVIVNQGRSSLEDNLRHYDFSLLFAYSYFRDSIDPPPKALPLI